MSGLTNFLPFGRIGTESPETEPAVLTLFPSLCWEGSLVVEARGAYSYSLRGGNIIPLYRWEAKAQKDHPHGWNCWFLICTHSLFSAFLQKSKMGLKIVLPS